MFKRDAKKILKSQKGMSLVEILIVISLIGIVMTLVVQNLSDGLNEGEVNSAKILMRNLGNVLDNYKRLCRTYPSTDQGLEALIEPPTSGRECKKYPPNGFLKDGKVPEDPWGSPFEYESDGRSYTIISYGVDGLEGGDGWDADISSKDL